MQNRITEKYFSQDDFSKRARNALKQIYSETGFIVGKEIFRGTIYNANKVGSLIYLGAYKNQPAVLKLQGLKPEVDEGKIIKHFIAQSKSKIVRVPELYFYRPWSAKRGYGYLITEYIKAPKIFKVPFAPLKEMKEFCSFYQEYRKYALVRPWIKPDKLNSLNFTLRRVENWRRISKAKKKLKKEDYISCLTRYFSLARKHLPPIPMVFCHAHLTADDIYKMPGGNFVVLSNLYWSYRPQWYDLALNIWGCLIKIRNTRINIHQTVNYVDKWLKEYRKIPIVRKDKDFNRKILILLLERVIGAILVDIGADHRLAGKKNLKYFKHLLKIHQQFFDILADRIDKYNKKVI